ncbi:YihY/virulence factor BrkB family protein [Ramlibacter sp. G-1-2-2]|uniref:YihY/virulence factor BrkB family protein n=1 Tax=Ramlibacter agri TaxID=2728837 RepID=A0A848H008_9BURK|nr:YihY/virulence factor BrkB family protein [Ramlibacter agri]NML42400.1 YihY/virulence factor BrkB family protein [Ramlibacter agri]
MAWQDKLPRWLQGPAHILDPLFRAGSLWSGAGGTTMSAAMSFYGILSLAPLLLAIVALLGWWMDRAVLEQGLVHEIGGIIGERGASLLADAMRNSTQGSQGLVASIVGFVVLLSGATGVFNELQQALEKVWTEGRAPLPRSAGFRYAAALRLRGVGYILVFGFLLLISLVVSTLLSMFSGWAGDRPLLEWLLRILNEAVAFIICAALFTGLMRLSGGPQPRMRCLVAGGCIGAILFTIGRQLLTAYLSKAAVVSAYGAAGSLVVLLMWIYFSASVLLFGAACARALDERVPAAQRGSSARLWAATSASAQSTPAASSSSSPQR